MQWHDFVFSQKPYYRLMRHSVFWVAWWLYFSVAFYLYQQPAQGTVQPIFVTVGNYLPIKTLLLVLLSAVACYVFIYIILPQIIKGKRLQASASILLLSVLLFAAGYQLYWVVFPFIDSLFGHYQPNRFFTRYWPAISLGLIETLKVVAAAGIIKYVKYWWLKQEESKTLERERNEAELQLLKAQIQPNFLFTSLNNLYVYSLAASPRAPEMLLKLSDLLSYMLYECDEPFVPLDKEIEMMKGYIALEKTRQNDTTEIELNVRGDMNDKTIAPFLLLPFIENCFKQSSLLTEHAWLNMDISIEGDAFTMNLANGILPNKEALPAFSENGLANVKKRLSLIYPKRHELKINQQREMLIVLLKIQLSEKLRPPSVEQENAFRSKAKKAKPTLHVSE